MYSVLARHLELLRVLGSPFLRDRNFLNEYIDFSWELYRLALVNKVVLSYLSRALGNDVTERLHRYHRHRLEVLMGILNKVCRVLEEYGFDYVVFKTLKPFEEEVSDIDILYLPRDYRGYGELVSILLKSGYSLMERSLYCTTFEDKRFKFTTELMIDVYREVSVGPLIYLDKELLRSYVKSRNVNGCMVKVLEPMAELSVTIAHAVFKEGKITLSDYLTALHYLYGMDKELMRKFVELAIRARIKYAAVLFLTIVAHAHRLAHGFVPSKVIDVLNALGGAINIPFSMLYNGPPFTLDRKYVVKAVTEKLGDSVFRRSLLNAPLWVSRNSLVRLVGKITARS